MSILKTKEEFENFLGEQLEDFPIHYLEQSGYDYVMTQPEQGHPEDDEVGKVYVRLSGSIVKLDYIKPYDGVKVLQEGYDDELSEEELSKAMWLFDLRDN